MHVRLQYKLRLIQSLGLFAAFYFAIKEYKIIININNRKRSDVKVNTDSTAVSCETEISSKYIIPLTEIPPVEIEVLCSENNINNGLEFSSFDKRFKINSDLLEVIKLKCDTDSNHMLHVAEFSNIICKRMGLSKDEIYSITNAALLHDIGKIRISSDVLFKPSRLSEEEFAVVKMHNVFGYNILKSLSDTSLSQYASKIALEHHEQISGNGYMGLSGNNIELGARIVAVADVFDALVSPRCYKITWTFEQGAGYITKNSGSFFDKEVVDAFSKSISDIEEIYSIYKNGHR